MSKISSKSFRRVDRLKLFVPIRVKDDKALIAHFEALCKLYGGATGVNGGGVWYDPSGKCLQEDICVWTFIGEHDEAFSLAYKFVERLFELGEQEVLIEFGGQSTFFTKERGNVQAG